MKTPLVFDIKRASTVDGPGIRTAVFFKGCNLDCRWCHNPEGKSPEPQVAFYSEKCIGCGMCRKHCPGGQKCTACGACAVNCPVQARRLYGKKYTPAELFKIIASDKIYYDATGGGVTFSGGECMLYPEFLAEVAKLCRSEKISVAVDTAGCVPFSSFETVLPYTDIFLYDIKCLDPELHKKGTGVSNGLILENLSRLTRSGKSIFIRIPCIPGFNEGEETERVKRYCEKLSLPYEVLSYHAMGESKKEALEKHSICNIK